MFLQFATYFISKVNSIDDARRMSQWLFPSWTAVGITIRVLPTLAWLYDGLAKQWRWRCCYSSWCPKPKIINHIVSEKMIYSFFSPSGIVGTSSHDGEFHILGGTGWQRVIKYHMMHYLYIPQWSLNRLYTSGLWHGRILLYHVLFWWCDQTKVHRAWWYMLHYGGPTPKKHIAFSNSPHVAGLWMGKLKNWLQTKQKLKEAGKSVELVQKYVDKHGKKRWKGTKQLRGSESDAYLLASILFRKHMDWFL